MITSFALLAYIVFIACSLYTECNYNNCINFNTEVAYNIGLQ